MHMLTLNVNGLNAAVRRGLLGFLEEVSPDVVCLQETRINGPQDLPAGLLDGGYTCVLSCAERLGYAGTLVLSRLPVQPLAHCRSTFAPASNPVPTLPSSPVALAESPLDNEGRITAVRVAAATPITIVSTYVPNSFKGHLARQDYRFAWDESYRAYAQGLLTRCENVVLCGDFNVDFDETPQTGFVSDEHAAMEDLLDAGFIDAWAALYPDSAGFTWYGGRKRTGHRMDGVLLGGKARDWSRNPQCKMVLHDVHLSDHVPLSIVVPDSGFRRGCHHTGPLF